jgi:creatinine amidohydrolase
LIWSELASPVLAPGPGQVALWPIGATEQHGPHLPTGTDTMIAEAVCRRAQELELSAAVLPALPIGCSAAHTVRWPGTLALRARTMIGLVVETAAWLAASGWDRLLLVNGHIGNVAPLRCAVDEIRQDHAGFRTGLINTWQLGASVTASFNADADDWHANRAETSVMMALAPGLVGNPGRADDPDRTGGRVFAWNVAATSRNGVTGRPSGASRDHGQELLAWMGEELARLVRQASVEGIPLEERALEDGFVPPHPTSPTRGEEMLEETC